MRTEMRAEIEAMLGEYRGLAARLDRTRTNLRSLTATARSADGCVTATVDPRGELVRLSIDEEAVRRLDAARLSARVLEAAGLAAAEVRRQVAAMTVELIPAPLKGALMADGTLDVPALGVDHAPPAWASVRP